MISRPLSTRRTALVAALVGLAIILAAAVAAYASPPVRSLLAPAASPPTMISYQGYVEVAGSAHNGDGYFKFAIVDAATGKGTTNYWANDGTASGEPSTEIQLSATGGLFDVMLGDTGIAGMSQALTAGDFSQTDSYLRVWFGTTSGGPFQALDPNRRIGSVPYALRAQEAIDADHAASADVAVIAQAVADNPAPCTASQEGSLRWTGTALEVCDGSDWRNVQLDSPPPPPMVMYGYGDGILSASA